MGRLSFLLAFSAFVAVLACYLIAICWRRMDDAQNALRALFTGEEELSGAQIMDRTGLGPSSVYPALIAMEDRGDLESRWEDGPYPRRRLYSMRGHVITPCSR